MSPGEWIWTAFPAWPPAGVGTECCARGAAPGPVGVARRLPHTFTPRRQLRPYQLWQPTMWAVPWGQLALDREPKVRASWLDSVWMSSVSPQPAVTSGASGHVRLRPWAVLLL